MGADFTFDCVIINSNLPTENAKALLLKKCANLKLSDFTEFDKDNLLEILDLELTVNTLPKIKTRFAEIINDIFDTLSSRECSRFTFKGYEIHLTGGMSWGDAPTDAFDTFGQFNALPECLHKLLE